LLIPFINRFPGLGDRETRVATFMAGDEIPAGKYFFLEFYCDDEACDCRRVIIKVVLESPEPEIIASIDYGWEEPEFYATWMGSEGEEDEMTGAILEPLLPQSGHSSFFLRFFSEMILRDPAYVERLKRHYAMFKAALPASPSSTEPPMPWSRAKRPKLAQKTKRKSKRSR